MTEIKNVVNIFQGKFRRTFSIQLQRLFVGIDGRCPFLLLLMRFTLQIICFGRRRHVILIRQIP